jgi:hypothetical protein
MIRKTINEFKTLDELKVFFDQQHECDRLVQHLLKKNSDGLDKSTKKPKRYKKRRKNNDDDTDTVENDD